VVRGTRRRAEEDGCTGISRFLPATVAGATSNLTIFVSEYYAPGNSASKSHLQESILVQFRRLCVLMGHDHDEICTKKLFLKCSQLKRDRPGTGPEIPVAAHFKFYQMQIKSV
jgi:hypothetical protein